MSWVKEAVELQPRRETMPTQHRHNFPTNNPSPSHLTRTASTQNYGDYCESLPHSRQPHDDNIGMNSPLLSTRIRATSAIDGDSQTSDTDQTGIFDQSRDSVLYPSAPNTRTYATGSEGQQGTGPEREEENRFKRTPKHIVRNGWTRYFHGCIVHMPALLMTAVVLGVGSRKFYWYPEEGPLITDYRVDADTISNVLQLVAKLHELFIVASLSSIALAMFRRSLITSGVRLGFLTGGYRVGDLAYLKTTAFCRQGFGALKPRDWLLPGFIVFATLMSTIVGPASAVLLVPTLGWYRIDTSVAFSKIELPLIYTWKRTNIWYPGRHDAPDRCEGVQGLYLDFCPAAGFPEISSWLKDFPATDLRNNLTFHSTSADLRRHLVFTLANNTQNSSLTTLCTTPLHFQKYIDHADVGALSREPRYRLQTMQKSTSTSPSQQNTTLYQPFIQAKCTVYDKEEAAKDPSSLNYPVGSLNCFNDKDCERTQGDNITYDKTLLKQDKWDNDSVVRQFLAPNNSPVVLIDGQIPDSSSGEPRHALYLCNLLASWVPSNFVVDPRVSDALQSSFSHDSVMQDFYRNNTQKDIKNLRFSKAWFEALNPTWNEGNTTGITALWRLVQNFYSKENLNGTNRATLSFIDPHENATDANYTAAEIFLAKVFGVYLTDGLARSTYEHQTTQLILNNTGDDQLTYINLDEQYGVRGGVHNLTSHNSTFYRDTWRGQTIDHKGNISQVRKDLETYLPIDIVADRYGYGSGQKRRTLQWAQAMMGIYLGIVVVYASWVGVMSVVDIFSSESSRGRTRVLSIIPWSDLQDLILLALRSPVPGERDLADAGAGVSSTRVWQTTVRAAADDDLNAHLVLGDAQVARRLKVDRSTRYY